MDKGQDQRYIMSQNGLQMLSADGKVAASKERVLCVIAVQK